jgi:uncharacterized protein YigE (DUF2233 family)
MTLCRVDLTHDRLEFFWLNEHREPYREFAAVGACRQKIKY